MKKYFSYFKLRFNVALQYRTSAIAGMFTQLFWGIMQILVYIAFYKNTQSSNISLEQLVSYVWLKQAFYTLISHITDSEIRSSVESGNVAYELIRPTNLYWMWFSKTIATRLSTGLIKFMPIILIASFLPDKYNLNPPESLSTLLLFIISLFIGVLLISAIINLFYISIFHTLTAKGTTSIFYALTSFFGGTFIPVALMPEIWQKICYVLPIGLAIDLPFRLYSGNIGINSGIRYIGLQIIWFIVLIIIGNILLKRELKKTVIQGG